MTKDFATSTRRNIHNTTNTRKKIVQKKARGSKETSGKVALKYGKTSYSCLPSPKFGTMSGFKPGATTYRDKEVLKQNQTTYRQVMLTLSNMADESFKHQEVKVAQDKQLLRFYRTRLRGYVQYPRS